MATDGEKLLRFRMVNGDTNTKTVAAGAEAQQPLYEILVDQWIVVDGGTWIRSDKIVTATVVAAKDAAPLVS